MSFINSENRIHDQAVYSVGVIYEFSTSRNYILIFVVTIVAICELFDKLVTRYDN